MYPKTHNFAAKKLVFHRCSYKVNYFSNLAYNSSILVLIYRSAAWNSKKIFILKPLFWILCFWFWVIPHLSFTSSNISLPLCIKLTMGQLLLVFLCNFRSFFKLTSRRPKNQLFSLFYWLIQVYFGYSAKYNRWGAFTILPFICRDLLNCLKSSLWS